MEQQKIIDNSQLSRFQECPRLYSYQFVEKLYLPVSPEAEFSKYLVHLPLGVWYLFEGSVTPTWELLWRMYVGAVKLPPGYLTLKTAQEIYQQYTERFRSDFDEYEVVAVEKLMPTTVAGFYVKPDVVWKRRQDGKMIPMDFKVSKYEQTTVPYNRQFLAQVDACGTDTFIKNFYQMGGGWIREEHLVPKDLQEEWREEVAAEMLELEKARETGIWPKRDKTCHQFCYREHKCCPMLELCEAGALRKVKMQGMMKKENPLDYLEV